jgi:hypothetical protein
MTGTVYREIDQTGLRGNAGKESPAKSHRQRVTGVKTRAARFASHWGMIRKLKSGQYRLYSRKKNAKTGRRRNLGTFSTRAAATKHEREVQYFKKR